MSGKASKLVSILRGQALTRRGAGFLGVLGLGMSALTYGVYKTSKFFARLTHWDSTKIGVYLGGVGTAVGVGLSARVYKKFTLPPVDRLVSEALVLLRANGEVREQVGASLRAGQFKAYAYGGGTRLKMPVTRERWSPEWPVERSPRNLQVMFQLLGERSAGMVSLRTDRRPLLRTGGREERFASLAVDFKNGERLVLAGEPQDVVFQGYTRLR